MDLPNAALSETTCDDAPASAAAPHWARARLERQQTMLDRAAEVAANMIAAIDDEVLAIRAERPAPEPDVTGEARLATAIARKKIFDDLGLTLHRVTRVLRLTFLLQQRIDEKLERLAWIEECDARGAKVPPPPPRPVRRVELVIASSALGEQAGETKAERLDRMTEAVERLNEDDHFGSLLSGPPSEAIGYIYDQLGVPPDWPALAETDWAQEEIASGRIGAPLRAVLNPHPKGPDGKPLEVRDTLTFVIPPLPPEKPRRRSG